MSVEGLPLGDGQVYSEAHSAEWNGPVERVDRALAALNLVRSRSQATEFVASGYVEIDGTIVRKSGVKVLPGSVLRVVHHDHYVGRAAHKLIAGLDEFQIDPTGALCVDVGASTGGFTQVLLERGAERVLAVDVGHDQMASSVKSDPRVSLFEGCNARDMTLSDLGLGASGSVLPTLVVADLSFISLTLVLPAMVEVADPAADFVLLVKPQFEVGRSGIKAGIVTDPERAAEAVLEVIQSAATVGLGVHGLIPSPIPGGYGNQEFVVHFSRTGEVSEQICFSLLRNVTTATIGTGS